jgi:hypothetical protein
MMPVLRCDDQAIRPTMLFFTIARLCLQKKPIRIIWAQKPRLSGDYVAFSAHPWGGHIELHAVRAIGSFQGPPSGL